MKLPKVLIVTPIYDKKDYCLERFLAYSKKLNYPNKQHIFVDNSPGLEYTEKLKEMGLEVYHVGRGNNSREAIARAQNFGRKIALEENYDYMFSLESDIMAPPDIIQALMRSGVDVISGRYNIGDKNKSIRIPCITLLKWSPELMAFGTRLLTPKEIPEFTNKGVKRVQAAGMGCCLMSRKSLEVGPFTYDPRLKGHSDIYFFNNMYRAGIMVFVNTDIYCEHENIPWDTVQDR